ncbi:MAG: hypothetical protein ABJZ55_08015 [Fuerstiella sp.]
MTKAVTDNLADLISHAESQFSLRVISFSNYRPTFLGDSDTAHAIKDSDLRDIEDERFFAIRDWFQQHDWLLSRQQLKTPPFNGTQHHYLAPIEYLTVDTVYHATRVANLSLITDGGLQPATADSCNFDRLDSFGYIYVTTALGQVGDYKNENLGTAHWWAELFAMDNRHSDRDWCVVQLDLSGLGDIICFNDLFSRTGVVLRPSDPIDPARLKRVA